MGRKIPGRKHRGIKDPEKQAAKKLNSIKDKINAPPINPDNQEIPKTLQRLIDLKDKMESGDFTVKKKRKLIPAKKPTVTVGKSKTKSKIVDKKVPKFEQLPNESDRQFVLRINRICDNVTKEAAFEDKYGVDITRDALGEIKLVKRPKDELEELIKDIRKAKQKKKVKKNQEETPKKLTKSQKWDKKKKEKKLKKSQKEIDEFEKYKDPIKFGELVHAPPTLIVPKKVEKIATTNKKKQLLLTPLLNDSESKPKPIKKKVKTKLASVAKKSIDKTGKRKNLPNALRRQLEQQQKEVIIAYKQLKKTTTA